MQQSRQLIGFVDERLRGRLAAQIVDAEHQQALLDAGQTLQILRLLDQIAAYLPPGSSMLGRVQADRLLLELRLLLHRVQTYAEVPDRDQRRVEILDERRIVRLVGGQTQREELIATRDHDVVVLDVLIDHELVLLVTWPSVGAEHVLIGLHAERLFVYSGRRLRRYLLLNGRRMLLNGRRVLTDYRVLVGHQVLVDCRALLIDRRVLLVNCTIAERQRTAVRRRSTIGLRCWMVLVHQNLVVVLVVRRLKRLAATHHDRILLELLVLDLAVEHLHELEEVCGEPEHVQVVVELLSG